MLGFDFWLEQHSPLPKASLRSDLLGRIWVELPAFRHGDAPEARRTHSEKLRGVALSITPDICDKDQIPAY